MKIGRRLVEQALLEAERAERPASRTCRRRAPGAGPLGSPGALARRSPSSERDSRSPGSSATAVSRCSTASIELPARRWISAASRCDCTSLGLTSRIVRQLRQRLGEVAVRQAGPGEDQPRGRVMGIAGQALATERDGLAGAPGLAVELGELGERQRRRIALEPLLLPADGGGERGIVDRRWRRARRRVGHRVGEPGQDGADVVDRHVVHDSKRPMAGASTKGTRPSRAFLSRRDRLEHSVGIDAVGADRAGRGRPAGAPAASARLGVGDPQPRGQPRLGDDARAATASPWVSARSRSPPPGRGRWCGRSSARTAARSSPRVALDHARP